MISQNKLKTIAQALTNVTTSCYHYFAPTSATMPYIVWYEESEHSALQAENHKAEQAAEGYVELFTKTEYDPLFDSIQSALNGIENLSWEWATTVYGDPVNDDNNTIHHTWVWRLR